tara:strand:- start:11478 stop:12281 length:804 start_codon:yes stop_codon:yes gene_type:complete
MPILVEYDSLIEGDLLDAESLNDRFSKVEKAVNDLHEDSTDRGCFNWHHLPTFSYGQLSPEGTPLSDTISQISACTYDTGVASTFVHSNFAVIDSNGSSGGGTELSITFPSSISLKSAAQGNPQAGGILVLMDVYVVRIGSYASSTWGADPHEENCVAFRIEVQEQPGGSWTALGRTERFIQEQNLSLGTTAAKEFRKQNINVPIRALVTQDDLTSTNTAISGVRGAISIKEHTGAHNVGVIIGHARLSALPLHSAVGTRVVNGVVQ